MGEPMVNQEDSLARLARPGDIIDGKFRVERVLGSGGMGLVVCAVHVELNTSVAIKLLHPTIVAQESVLTRFKREAQTAATLRSEHVARVTDFGTLPGGAPFLVMEYLEGQGFDGLLADARSGEAKLRLEDTIDFVVQACEALSEAHEKGIIHRDLKPANLFVTGKRDGSAIIKVLDFGISKLTNSSLRGADLTQSQNLLGTPLYMAPEQLRSARRVTARTDVWALGVILYEALAGRPPFLADEFGELFYKIQNEAPEPLAIAAPAVPPRVAEIVMTCLEKDPERRLESVVRLAELIAPFGTDRARRMASSLRPATTPISYDERSSVIPQHRSVDTQAATQQVSTLEPMTARSGANVTIAPKSRTAALVGVAALAACGIAASAWLLSKPAQPRGSPHLESPTPVPVQLEGSTGDGLAPRTEPPPSASALPPATASSAPTVLPSPRAAPAASVLLPGGPARPKQPARGSEPSIY